MRLESKTNQLLTETMNRIVTIKGYIRHNINLNVISKQDKNFMLRTQTLHMKNLVCFYETINMNFETTI